MYVVISNAGGTAQRGILGGLGVITQVIFEGRKGNRGRKKWLFSEDVSASEDILIRMNV